MLMICCAQKTIKTVLIDNYVDRIIVKWCIDMALIKKVEYSLAKGSANSKPNYKRSIGLYRRR